MGHSVTLGGERVGSGKKNKIYLHNYERSTHDLSEKFTSTMGTGMLIPFMCKLVTRDDKFEIDLNAGLRTIPTKGPLFGSMKLQLDVYQCPLRLYQALLHNNPLAIGLKANQIKFPKARFYGKAEIDENTELYKSIMSANNSLTKYVGISGIGTPNEEIEENSYIYRDLFSASIIAYYDIFKNYYANKQENLAYQLKEDFTYTNYADNIIIVPYYNILNNTYQWTNANGIKYLYTKPSIQITPPTYIEYNIKFYDKNGNKLKLTEEQIKNIVFEITYYNSGDNEEQTIHGSINTLNLQDILYNYEIRTDEEGYFYLMVQWIYSKNYYTEEEVLDYTLTYVSTAITEIQIPESYDVILQSFELKQIDDLRMDILSHHTLGQTYLLDFENNIDQKNNFKFLYNAIGDKNNRFWQQNLAGICVKTYQSDIFNNWINTEWIDGENGINAITALSVVDGKITIDALQFQSKLYNLLNRVAVSGNTYEDYLDAAYTESDKRFCETPLWIGGMSEEIIFEEIVQTAPAEGDPLGTLGGRGNLAGNKKGGKITVKIDEPSLIIGIVSITPRIQYTQGNDWFNTEIDNLQDIHVPALDGIGFQNLLAERMHAGSTILNDNGTFEERQVVGKVPAWIEYMTSYDRAFGDFLNNTNAGDGFMIFNRDYMCEGGILLDATTYIDPAKYNYAFAYTKRDAQNFWIQIKSNIKARRLMSARQIPTA